MLDSGASMHFTHDINDFVDYEVITPIPCKTATSVTSIIGKGAIILDVAGWKVQIQPVYYIPEITSKLLSLGTFLLDGLLANGSASSIRLFKPDEGRNFLTFHPRKAHGSIFVIHAHLSKEAWTVNTLTSIYSIDYNIMHCRLAHPSKDVLRQARKNVQDFPFIQFPHDNEELCPGCAQGKMSSQTYPPSETWATAPFELIHSDLKSFPVESYRRYKYSIVFFDDYTSHAWTINLHSKDAAIGATKQVLAMVETKYKAKVRKWMSDAGGEYKSMAFLALLKELGIEVLQSVPHIHQQNRRAERIIRTLTEKAQAMWLEACLPQSWWEFALEHATHVYNRTPVRRLKWQTPYFMLHQEKPTIDHLQVFGCGAYIFIPEEVRINKLSLRSEMMIYLGGAPRVKGWIFMRSPNNIIFTAA